MIESKKTLLALAAMASAVVSFGYASTLVAVGAEFHVELNGNDSNPGTAQKPFATVERAVEALKGVRKASAEPVREERASAPPT